jgi:hypothetical protein
MYPRDDFNQRLQLVLQRDQIKQVVIEIQESYGDVKNRTLDLNIEDLDSIEYCGGIYEITYGNSEQGMTTEFIAYDRIRGITFRDKILRYDIIPPAPPANWSLNSHF